MRRDIERLQDILEAVDRVQKHAPRDARPSTETSFCRCGSAVERDLPALKAQVEAILREEPNALK